MQWTVGELIGGAAGVIVLLSALIEITPIKINPISKFLGWIGTKTNRNIMDKFDMLDTQVQELADKVDKIEYEDNRRNAITCRVRILRFGDECRARMEHSQEAFDQVLDDINVYDKYCNAHPEFVNNKTELTAEYIKDTYRARLEKNDFL